MKTIYKTKPLFVSMLVCILGMQLHSTALAIEENTPVADNQVHMVNNLGPALPQINADPVPFRDAVNMAALPDNPPAKASEASANEQPRLTEGTPESGALPITVKVIPPETVTYTYDSRGNRITMTDWRGTTTYTYDSLNRLTRVTEPDGKYVAYTYDLNGNRLTMRDHFGGTTSYTYTNAGGLSTLTDRSGGVTSYIYDTNGRLQRMNYPNGTYAEYTYNDRDWLVTLNNKKSDGTIIAGFTYEYNPATCGKNGTRTAMTENILKPDGSRIQSRVDYQYDDNYRRTRETRTGDLPYDKIYTYDNAGNLLTQVENGTTTYYHYDAANKLINCGPASTVPYAGNTFLAYDGARNMVSVVNSNGAALDYTWDWMNKLVSVDQGITNIVKFGYDGDENRRSVLSATGEATFLYEDGRVLEEEYDQGNKKVFYTFGDRMLISRQIDDMTYYHIGGMVFAESVPNTQSSVASFHTRNGLTTHAQNIGKIITYPIGLIEEYWHPTYRGIRDVVLDLGYQTPGIQLWDIISGSFKIDPSNNSTLRLCTNWTMGIPTGSHAFMCVNGECYGFTGNNFIFLHYGKVGIDTYKKNETRCREIKISSKSANCLLSKMKQQAAWDPNEEKSIKNGKIIYDVLAYNCTDWVSSNLRDCGFAAPSVTVPIGMGHMANMVWMQQELANIYGKAMKCYTNIIGW